MKEYTFREATSLLDFLERSRDKIIGQHINGFYSDVPVEPFGMVSTSSAFVFELDNYSIILLYFWYSDLNLYVVNTQELKKDLSLNFLFKDIPYSRNLTYYVNRQDFPFAEGHVINDIQKKRFSDEIGTNPSTGETRPAGGDYFSTIEVFLDNGEVIHICAENAYEDGYMLMW